MYVLIYWSLKKIIPDLKRFKISMIQILTVWPVPSYHYDIIGTECLVER